MSFTENRAEPREPLALPLRLGKDLCGTTRDISASGMYLEISGDHEFGSTVMFEMDIEEANMRFTAQGLIVRVEHRDGRTGIAVKLLSPRLQALA